MNILYSIPLYIIEQVTIFWLILWTVLLYFLKNSKIFCFVNTVLLIFAVYGILSFTVLGRTPSNDHQFVWYTIQNVDYVWEMGMNAFLYFPLGLTLSATLCGSCFVNLQHRKKCAVTIIGTIIIGAVMSVIIEISQYVAGTGLAQGTDVLMNTLGSIIGCIPSFITECMHLRHKRTSNY